MAADASRRERRWTLLLVALALTLPVGSLLQPWLFPSRSALPLVTQGLRAPLVLVTVPGLRADRLGHLGHAAARTPVLDRLAVDGVSFARAYASSNEPRASLAAMHGGTSPSLSGVFGPGGTLAKDTFTLAERLARHGLHTVAVRADPSQAGMGLEQGFADVLELPPDTPADALFERGLQALRGAPTGSAFVWIDLGDLRWPYGGAGFGGGGHAPGLPPGFGEDLPTQSAAREAALSGWSEQERAWLEARYDASLARVDGALGRFLEGLAADVILETATICVAGTSGAPLLDRPGRALTPPADLYEESVHVPLLFRLPGRAARGRVLSEFAHSVDVGPTLLKLALKSGRRSEWAESCGRSLLKTMVARNDINTFAVSQGSHLRADGQRVRRGVAVWSDRFKTIGPAVGDRARELFDLSADPGERHDDAAAKPAVAAGLAGKARKWEAACGRE